MSQHCFSITTYHALVISLIIIKRRQTLSVKLRFNQFVKSSYFNFTSRGRNVHWKQHLMKFNETLPLLEECIPNNPIF